MYYLFSLQEKVMQECRFLDEIATILMVKGERGKGCVVEKSEDCWKGGVVCT